MIAIAFAITGLGCVLMGMLYRDFDVIIGGTLVVGIGLILAELAEIRRRS